MWVEWKGFKLLTTHEKYYRNVYKIRCTISQLSLPNPLKPGVKSLLKMNRLLSIYTSNVLLKFALYNQSQTEVKSLETEKIQYGHQAAKLWKWHLWKRISLFSYTQVMCSWCLDFIFKAKLKLESGNWKIQYGHQAAIFKVTLLKINRLISIYTRNLLLLFGLDNQSQTKFRVRKLKNPIWLPGGYFECHISENL